MTDAWADADRAWGPWVADVKHLLRTLPHGEAMFIYPVPADRREWPLSGPSIRIMSWHDGEPIAVGRLPDRPDAAEIWGPILARWGWRLTNGIRFARILQRRRAPREALVLRLLVEQVYGCVHPSFVEVGPADVSADAALWEQVLRTRLVLQAHADQVRRLRPPSTYQRYGGDQPSLLPESDVDPSTPTLWD